MSPAPCRPSCAVEDGAEVLELMAIGWELVSRSLCPGASLVDPHGGVHAVLPGVVGRLLASGEVTIGSSEFTTRLMVSVSYRLTRRAA